MIARPHHPHRPGRGAGDLDPLRLSQGLPVGLQVIGPIWRGEIVVRVATAYRSVSVWDARSPAAVGPVYVLDRRDMRAGLPGWLTRRQGLDVGADPGLLGRG